MKSRVYNNTNGAKDMGTYFELPLKQFLSQMPQYAEAVLRCPVDVNDDKYMVRFCFGKDGFLKEIEIGYPEDDWNIGKE